MKNWLYIIKDLLSLNSKLQHRRIESLWPVILDTETLAGLIIGLRFNDFNFLPVSIIWSRRALLGKYNCFQISSELLDVVNKDSVWLLKSSKLIKSDLQSSVLVVVKWTSFTNDWICPFLPNLKTYELSKWNLTQDKYISNLCSPLTCLEILCWITFYISRRMGMFIKQTRAWVTLNM